MTKIYANPDYGKGRFRRRIRLSADTHSMLAELEDEVHGFRSHLKHDGERLLAVRGEALRYPINLCPGATEPLTQLEGMPIDTYAGDINRLIDPTHQCTHLFDLSILALGHCHAGAGEWLYDMVVEDEVDEQPADAHISLNGEEILRWSVLNWSIQEPAALAGNTLSKGFAAWASQTYQGQQQMAAFALQKAYFVAFARRFDMETFAGQPIAELNHMHNQCFSHQSSRIERARRRHHVSKDFSHDDSELLKFIDAGPQP